jgi:hypothetical protein
MESCDTRVVKEGSRPAMVVGFAGDSVNLFAGSLVDLRRLDGVFAAERDFLRCRAGQPTSPYFVYTFIHELNINEMETIYNHIVLAETDTRTGNSTCQTAL